MKKKVLSDHRRQGKKFIPPAQYLIGFTEIHYIERILPEIAWIQYFIEKLGIQDGIDTAIKFLKTSFFLKEWGKLPEFSLLSNYRMLESNDWEELKERLNKEQVLEKVKMALEPFVCAYPQRNPFANLVACTEESTQECIDLARSVIEALFDRRSKTATIAQSVILFVEIDTGKLKYTEKVPLPNLNSIFIDFDSEEARRTSAHVRMKVNQVFSFYEKDIGEDWSDYFWNRGRVLSPLETDYDTPAIDEPHQHPLAAFGMDFESYARSLLREVWKALPVDIFRSEPFEVLGALLSRQCNLAVKVILNPGTWDFYSGPLFLRAMVDNYITVAWILKDPLDRSRKFILYGLGQEKLQIEHLKTELEFMDDEDKERMQQSIDAREAWVNCQRFTFLQEVDIGSWSGISTRKMAEEADCISLYRFAYTPWSQAAHGVWNHVGRFDSKTSDDPLHKHIRQPFFFEHQEFDVVVNTAKYFDKMFRLVADHFNLEIKLEPPYEWVLDRVEGLNHAMIQYQKAQQFSGGNG